MRHLPLLLSLITLSFSTLATATCRDTDQVLEGTGRLNRVVAELKHDVDLIAFATPAANDMAVLRTRLEAFYDDVYSAQRSCGCLKRRFQAIDAVGQQAVTDITNQGLTAEQEINDGLVDLRFGLLNLRGLIDQLD